MMMSASAASSAEKTLVDGSVGASSAVSSGEDQGNGTAALNHHQLPSAPQAMARSPDSSERTQSAWVRKTLPVCCLGCHNTHRNSLNTVLIITHTICLHLALRRIYCQ